MLANSENPRQRQFARYNRGACHATIIDTNFLQEQQSTTTNATNGQVVSTLEEAHAIARSVLAADSESDIEE
jgi:hypothetical protein